MKDCKNKNSLHELFKSFRAQGRKSRKPRSRKARFEQLEDRNLLAVGGCGSEILGNVNSEAASYAIVSKVITAESCPTIYPRRNRIQLVDVEGMLKVKAIPGQGTSAPNEWIWNDHCLLQYGNVIIDPSYGLRYVKGIQNNALETVQKEIVLSTLESVGDNRNNTYNLGLTVTETNFTSVKNRLRFIEEAPVINFFNL